MAVVTVTVVVIVPLLVKTTWHLDNRCDILRAAFRDSRDVFCWLVSGSQDWRGHGISGAKQIPTWRDVLYSLQEDCIHHPPRHGLLLTFFWGHSISWWSCGWKPVAQLWLSALCTRWKVSTNLVNTSR